MLVCVDAKGVSYVACLSIVVRLNESCATVEDNPCGVGNPMISEALASFKGKGTSRGTVSLDMLKTVLGGCNEYLASLRRSTIS